MLRPLSMIAPIILATSLLAADLSEKWSKRLESADANYQSAVQKADNVRFYAVQKAAQERVKILKTALADATKGGDFDAATEIKARVASAETAGGVRPKPKNVVKFGGHEYALIEDKATWHVAKRLCEEMGGHLVTIETPPEADAVREICRRGKSIAWIGATDEEQEESWHWINGRPVELQIRTDKDESQNHLVYHPPSESWDDIGDGRFSFVCEWE